MNKKTMRVGHVVRRYIQLTENFIRSYLVHAQNHLPCVLTDVLFAGTDEEIPCVYLIDKDQIHEMPSESRHFFFEQLDYPNCYTQTVLTRQLDILHAHFGSMGYRSLRLKKKTRLPLVVSFYGVDASHMLGLPRWQKRLGQVFQEADAITALGTDMANRLCDAGCPEHKIHIVHLGVDTNSISFYPRVCSDPDQSIVLLYCGRLVEKKGVFDALQAFACAADLWPQLHFRIVGDGFLRPKLNRTIKEMGLEKRVHVLGALSHNRVLQEMARAHVFILPSKTAENGDKEGTPTVLLEAGASGLPVVSTFHADIPEVVMDGQSGFLVSEGNVSALADRLCLLLSEPDLWAPFGRAGRAHIEKQYHIGKEVKKLEAMYRKLV